MINLRTNRHTVNQQSWTIWSNKINLKTQLCMSQTFCSTIKKKMPHALYNQFKKMTVRLYIPGINMQHVVTCIPVCSGIHLALLFKQCVWECVLSHTKGLPTQLTSSVSIHTQTHTHVLILNVLFELTDFTNITRLPEKTVWLLDSFSDIVTPGVLRDVCLRLDHRGRLLIAGVSSLVVSP